MSVRLPGGSEFVTLTTLQFRVIDVNQPRAYSLDGSVRAYLAETCRHDSTAPDWSDLILYQASLPSNCIKRNQRTLAAYYFSVAGLTRRNRLFSVAGSEQFGNKSAVEGATCGHCVNMLAAWVQVFSVRRRLTRKRG